MPVIEWLGHGVFWFGFVFCAAAGVVCARLQVRACRLAYRSRRWPSAPGAITRAEIQEIVSEVDGALVRSFRPRVEYSYVAGGRRWRHSRIAFGKGIYLTGVRAYPEWVVRAHRERSAVPVYYDPMDPGNAVLEPGRLGWEHGIAALIFLCAAALLWRFVRG